MAKNFSLRRSVFVDPCPLQIVGDNDVIRQTSVFVNLIRFQHLVEIFADCFVLDVSENETFLCDFEIRSAFVSDPLRLMLNGSTASCLIRNSLQKCLKRSAISVLRLLVNWNFTERQKIAAKNIV